MQFTMMFSGGKSESAATNERTDDQPRHDDREEHVSYVFPQIKDCGEFIIIPLTVLCRAR